jgi:hypothetical protein
MRDDKAPLFFDSQHCLNFLPLPHGQGSLRPVRVMFPPLKPSAPILNATGGDALDLCVLRAVELTILWLRLAFAREGADEV